MRVSLKEPDSLTKMYHLIWLGLPGAPYLVAGRPPMLPLGVFCLVCFLHMSQWCHLEVTSSRQGHLWRCPNLWPKLFEKKPTEFAWRLEHCCKTSSAQWCPLLDDIIALGTLGVTSPFQEWGFSHQPASPQQGTPWESRGSAAPIGNLGTLNLAHRFNEAWWLRICIKTNPNGLLHYKARENKFNIKYTSRGEKSNKMIRITIVLSKLPAYLERFRIEFVWLTFQWLTK